MNIVYSRSLSNRLSMLPSLHCPVARRQKHINWSVPGKVLVNSSSKNPHPFTGVGMVGVAPPSLNSSGYQHPRVTPEGTQQGTKQLGKVVIKCTIKKVKSSPRHYALGSHEGLYGQCLNLVSVVRSNLECSYTDSPGRDTSPSQVPSKQCLYSYAAE